MINLIHVTGGTRLKLIDGAVGEVVENGGDGQWVSIRYLSHPEPSQVGQEELCHAADIVSVIEGAARGD